MTKPTTKAVARRCSEELGLLTYLLFLLLAIDLSSRPGTFLSKRDSALATFFCNWQLFFYRIPVNTAFSSLSTIFY